MRTERIKITTTMKRPECPAAFDELVRLSKIQARDGDQVTINYAIVIDYLGKSSEWLEAFIKLHDAGGIVEADVEELMHGKCLAQELFLKIAALQERLKK